MNAFLVATMILGAAASDQVALAKTSEFIQIEHTLNDIASRIAKVKSKESDDESDWISFDDEKAGDEPAEDNKVTSLLEEHDTIEDVQENLKENAALHKVRICKTFKDTQLSGVGDLFSDHRSAWESCLQSCKDSPLCAQVTFDKETKMCTGHKVAMTKTAPGVAPEKFMSAHCKVGAEKKEADKASLLQTQEKPKVSDEVAFNLYEAQMKMEEKLAQEDQPKPVIKEDQPKPVIKEQRNLKVKKVTKKQCMTFETENLIKKGSLLQMGKKLLQSETTGDFLTCLQKCQKDAACKQVVYDKQASQCYKHDEVAVQKTDAKGTKYIAATCQ